MWIGFVWASVTVEIMSSYEEEIQDVEFQLVKVNKKHYSALVEEIRIRMERIRYAQSCESSVEEERYFPLVRMGAGVPVGG